MPIDCVPVDAFDSKYFWKWRGDAAVIIFTIQQRQLCQNSWAFSFRYLENFTYVRKEFL